MTSLHSTCRCSTLPASPSTSSSSLSTENIDCDSAPSSRLCRQGLAAAAPSRPPTPWPSDLEEFNLDISGDAQSRYTRRYVSLLLCLCDTQRERVRMSLSGGCTTSRMDAEDGERGRKRRAEPASPEHSDEYNNSSPSPPPSDAPSKKLRKVTSAALKASGSKDAPASLKAFKAMGAFQLSLCKGIKRVDVGVSPVFFNRMNRLNRKSAFFIGAGLQQFARKSVGRVVCTARARTRNGVENTGRCQV